VTSTTTQSSSATPPKVTVDSADLGGNPISGLWSTAQSSGNPIAGGFTPFSFPIVPGSTYIVCVADFGSYVFSSWADGSTTRCVSVSPSRDTVLTAVYATGSATPTPIIAVHSVDLGGSPIAGLWTVFQSSGLTIATGFTPTSHTISAGASYTVCVSNYANYAFSHWPDGSTNPCVTISPTQDTALTASYDTGASGTRTTTATSTSTPAAAPTTSIGSGGHRSD
jgi:hypothetical protein